MREFDADWPGFGASFDSRLGANRALVVICTEACVLDFANLERINANDAVEVA